MIQAKISYSLFLVGFWFWLSANSVSAQMKTETLKAAFLYHFTQNISQQNVNSISTYKICFLSPDSVVYKEFKKILNTEKIKNKINGKPAELICKTKPTGFSGIQMLYVDKSYNDYIESIADLIQGGNILLVTDQYADAKYIMLNFLYEKNQQTISFEMNKANLIIENLTFKPDILLLGGKEIDIRDLYENTKKMLDQSVGELEKEKQLIEIQKNQLNKQIREADSLRQNINFLTLKTSSSEDRLKSLTFSIVSQQKNLNEKLHEIQIREDKIKLQNLQISFKENQIAQQTLKLDSLVGESSKQQKTIDSQKSILDSKENMIVKQRKNLYFVIFGGFLLLLFGIVILTAFLVKRTAAAQLEMKVKERTRELQEEIGERINTEIELEKHKSHLEQLVKDRTVEISNIYDELKSANTVQINVNKILNQQKEELEQTLEMLKLTQNQLIQSEKMASLGILTAGIAHEINNPINFINSGLEGLNSIVIQLTEILEKYKNNPEKFQTKNESDFENIDFLISGIQKLTKNIKTGVIRSTEIIKSLNTFSRTEDENLVLSDICKIIDSALVLLYNSYKNNIEIVKNYNEPIEIFCFPGKLNQVFVNLILNAVQAIEDKGKIIISVSSDETTNINEKEPKFVKITVKDTGFGMPDNVKNRIFEPFFTTKETGKGTGLGLSITHGIIEQHNGRIEVNSKPGEGTEFIIFLPVDLKKN